MEMFGVQKNGYFENPQPGTYHSHLPEAVAAPGQGRERKPSARSRCGRKRFGFYNGEQEAIAEMVRLRAQGFGFDKIANALNASDIRSRSGKAWHGRVVNRILKAAGEQVSPLQPRSEDAPEAGK